MSVIRPLFLSGILFFLKYSGLGQKESGDGQRSAQSGQRRDFFVKDDRGGDYGNHGHDVDIYAGLHSSQEFYGVVPGDKAECRGAQSQVEYIRQVQRSGKAGEFQMKVEKEQRGKHEQNAVKEGAAGGEDSAVAVTADFFRQNGVERPDEGREKRQQIAHGIQRQLRTVEADEADARHGHQKSEKEAAAEFFLFFQEDVCHDPGEKRRRRHDDSHVGG